MHNLGLQRCVKASDWPWLQHNSLLQRPLAATNLANPTKLRSCLSLEPLAVEPDIELDNIFWPTIFKRYLSTAGDDHRETQRLSNPPRGGSPQPRSRASPAVTVAYDEDGFLVCFEDLDPVSAPLKSSGVDGRLDAGLGLATPRSRDHKREARATAASRKKAIPKSAPRQGPASSGPARHRSLF